MGQRKVKEDLEKVNNEYHNAKKELKDQGFRVDGVFDVRITTATTIKRKERKEDQAQALLKKKGAFSASSIYTYIGSMCVPSPSITQVQRIKLEREEELKKIAQEKKQERDTKKYAEAVKTLMKF